MNAQYINQLLIVGILFTITALGLHPYLPQKHLELLNNPEFSPYLFSSNNNQGKSLAFWQDQTNQVWGCNVPEDLRQDIYPTCSYSVWLAKEQGKGVDFSSFSYLLVDLDYQGGNDRLRVSIRNFNSKYSKNDDPNTTKFNAVRVEKNDFSLPLKMRLNEFSVADWWLRQFNISRANSEREMNNVISVGIDFEDMMTPGTHRIHIKQLTLSGSWISRDKWYLLILSPWLFGILFYAINQLRLLRRQAKTDSQRIDQLAQQNNKLRQQSEEFRRLSTVDPLTQCFNRFGIHQIIASLLAQEPSNHPQFSLILLDIDYFKRINDQRGHDAGDRVLHIMGTILHDQIRSHDFVGRWGGEEFILVMPHTNKETAMALAEKIRLLIFKHIFEPDQPLSVTVSLGIGEHKNNEDFASTFKRVDLALYKAKHTGRNSSVQAD